MLTRLRTRFSAVVLMAFSMVAFSAFAAFATADSAETTAAKAALDNAKTEASSLISYGVPVVLAVAVMWVALKFGKRLIGKL